MADDRRVWACVAMAVLLFACGDDETAATGSSSSGAGPGVQAVCDKYDALDAQCGYDKFNDRAGCESGFSACAAADLDKVQVFYDCLAACNGAGGGNSIEDLSSGCASTAFGPDLPACLN